MRAARKGGPSRRFRTPVISEAWLFHPGSVPIPGRATSDNEPLPIPGAGACFAGMTTGTPSKGRQLQKSPRAAGIFSGHADNTLTCASFRQDRSSCVAPRYAALFALAGRYPPMPGSGCWSKIRQEVFQHRGAERTCEDTEQKGLGASRKARSNTAGFRSTSRAKRHTVLLRDLRAVSLLLCAEELPCLIANVARCRTVGFVPSVRRRCQTTMFVRLVWLRPIGRARCIHAHRPHSSALKSSKSCVATSPQRGPMLRAIAAARATIGPRTIGQNHCAMVLDR